MLLISVTTTIDKTPYEDSGYFKTTQNRINEQTTHNCANIQIGWSKQSITPQTPQRLAGYTYRKPYEAIKDSVSMSCFYFSSEKEDFVILQYELLLIHEDLRISLEKSIKANFPRIQGIYYMCSHAHTSFGGWATGILGTAILGGYDQSVVDMIIEKSLAAIQESHAQKSDGNFYIQKIELEDFTNNRVAPGMYTDNYLRTIFFKNSSQGISALTSFSGHPTLISMYETNLSGDYPSALTSKLATDLKLSLSTFGGGTMGSTSIKDVVQSYDFAQSIGYKLADTIASQFDSSRLEPIQNISFNELQIELPTTQYKLTQSLVLRPFASELLFAHPTGKLSLLSINKDFLIGFPGEISGEAYHKILYQDSLFPTSFNGDYIGYLSASEHYYSDHSFETKDMNLYGPNNTDYIIEVTNIFLSKHLKK